MKALVQFIFCIAVLLVCAALTGCVTSRSRSEYIEHLNKESVTNLTAYRAGNEIEIRYSLGAKNVFAHARWMSPPNDADCHHRFALLTFEKEARHVRKSAFASGSRLAIRNGQEWQHLVDAVFADLVPDQTNHGVLLLVQNLEVVVFRDAARKLTAAKLESKPSDVIVDHTYGDTDFSRKALGLLESEINSANGKRSAFLFATGKDPAFAFIDLKEHLVVFLSYPPDPESQPTEVPGWFTLRALNSLVIKSLILSSIKNPFTVVTRCLWHLGNSGATVLNAVTPGPGGTPAPLYKGKGMDLAAWEKHLDEVVSARRYRGRVRFLIDGSEFFPALIQSIESASNSIDLMVYIFGNDDYAVKIADVLKERSSNVKVRVLMDEMGTLFGGGEPPGAPVPVDFKAPDSIKSYLRSESRVRVRTSTNPWLTADHRKCIIIDSRLAYIGGMNIGRVYRYNWHDMMVGLTGPIVGRLEKGYRKAWAHAGPLGDFAYAWVSLFSRTHPKRNVIPDSIEIRPLRTATGKQEIYRAQLEAIRQAKRYIYIESAYFSDDTVLRALIQARQRGVDVRVVLPAETDIGVMQTGNLVMANEMIRNGIRVFAYPGMTHVKAAIYDGWACLGSANMEKMSLRVSQELDVAFSDPATVDRLKADLFEADFARSRELKDPVPLSWYDSLIKGLADQF